MHLEILGFPMGGAYKYRDISAWFKPLWRKKNLASTLDNPKRKLGVTMHFSEIIKLHFGIKKHTSLCILLLF